MANDENIGLKVGAAAAVALLIGLFFGSFVFTNEVQVDKIVEVEVIKEVSIEVEVEKIVKITPLDEAVTEFMKAVEHEEDEAGHDVEVFNGDYDFDEISVRKVYDSYLYFVDGDLSGVYFDIKLKAKESGESSVREVYHVTVTYDEDEDTTILVESHDFEVDEDLHPLIKDLLN